MNTESYRLAYRAGQEAARSEFEKGAGLARSAGNTISALGGRVDPRVALALGIAVPTATATMAPGLIDDIAKAGASGNMTATAQLYGLGAGSVGSAALAGAANPGLARQSGLIPRLSSEFASASQTPAGMARSLALVLGIPYGLYQLGKKVGENESSIF